jgi:hypothetical protein
MDDSQNTALAGKGVVLATPSRDGRAYFDYTVSAINTFRACDRAGVKCGILLEMNESLLPAGRNRLVAKFLQQDPAFTHLLFVDDDMSWQPESVLRLLAHGEDFVAGPYVRRDETPSPRWTCKLELEPEIDGRGLTRAFGVGMGFTMISRVALEKMCRVFAHETYEDLSLPGKHHWLFDIEVRDGQINGEDYVFCRKYRETGGTIYVDTTIELGHIGRHEWKANLADGIGARHKMAAE